MICNEKDTHFFDYENMKKKYKKKINQKRI